MSNPMSSAHHFKAPPLKELVQMLENELCEEKQKRIDKENVIDHISHELGKSRLSLGRSDQRLFNMIEGLADGFLFIRNTGVAGMFNTSFVSLFNMRISKIRHQPLNDIMNAMPITSLSDEMGTDLKYGSDHWAEFLTKHDDLVIQTTNRDFIQVRTSWTAEGGSLHIFRDITKRIALMDQLSIAQKREALGTLASGIAHEINTPTQYVRNNLQFLKNSMDDLIGYIDHLEQLIARSGMASPESLAAVREARDVDFILEELPLAINQTQSGAAKITEIVQAIKHYSHPNMGRKASANVNSLLKNAMTMTMNEWKHVATPDYQLDPKMQSVLLFPNDLEQVFINLIVNACHAMENAGKTPKTGQIAVRTSFEDAQIRIEVEDNGCGISEIVLTKLFDPFYTTKAPGKGTGQGLSVCQTIIEEKHRGRITVWSEPHKGSLFTIIIPVERIQSEKDTTEGI